MSSDSASLYSRRCRTQGGGEHKPRRWIVVGGGGGNVAKAILWRGECTPSRYHQITASLASCQSVGCTIFEYPLFSEYQHFSLQSGPPVEAVISTLNLKQPKTLTPTLTLTLTQTIHLSYLRFFKCQMREFVSPMFLMWEASSSRKLQKNLTTASQSPSSFLVRTPPPPVRRHHQIAALGRDP